jgi:hypothetical protein
MVITRGWEESDGSKEGERGWIMVTKHSLPPEGCSVISYLGESRQFSFYLSIFLYKTCYVMNFAQTPSSSLLFKNSPLQSMGPELEALQMFFF